MTANLKCFEDSFKCFEYREDGTTQIREELSPFLEEADTRIIPHIIIFFDGYKRIVVISNNTDVFVLILHYMSLFFDKGINELSEADLGLLQHPRWSAL